MDTVFLYFAVLSVISLVVTCYDKHAAVRRKRRISEKALFLWALAGGSAAMYITMLLIRHKTLHKRFMIGLPLIIAAQIALLWWLSPSLF